MPSTSAKSDSVTPFDLNFFGALNLAFTSSGSPATGGGTVNMRPPCGGAVRLHQLRLQTGRCGDPNYFGGVQAHRAPRDGRIFAIRYLSVQLWTHLQGNALRSYLPNRIYTPASGKRLNPAHTSRAPRYNQGDSGSARRKSPQLTRGRRAEHRFPN